MTLAIGQFPQERHRDANQSAVGRRRAANQPHATGSVSRAQQFPPAVATALWASRNTYLTAMTPQQSQYGSLEIGNATWTEGDMHELNYALKELCRRNHDGSYATRADREHILSQVADQLRALGYRQMDAQSLKPKHVEGLVQRWLADRLSPGTIKNRMSALRWWAEKVGKKSVVARSNMAYGIRDRTYVTNASKAKELGAGQLAQIRDVCTQTSLRLQEAFGLRREESIKIVPAWADRGQSLVLKDSWCKGGREREIPIRTIEQRQILDEAKALAKGKSLVGPGYATYAAYLSHFRYECERAGIHGVHGYRHFYAQARYQELTGHDCPARGGPTSKQLTPKQKATDRAARETISHEMGHGREQVTAVYLGR